MPTFFVNSALVRSFRQERGWTQKVLAERAGYSARLIRKAESGRVRRTVIEDLAECLSSDTEKLTFERLTSNPLRAAQMWMTTFDKYGVDMLRHIEGYFAENLVFHCEGRGERFPFNGTFHGLAGHQAWLDAFFSVFTRVQGIDVTYTVGNDLASARWQETVYLMRHLASPFVSRCTSRCAAD